MNRAIKNCPGWSLSDELGHLKAYNSTNDTQIYIGDHWLQGLGMGLDGEYITVSLRSPVHTVDIPLAVVRALLAEKRKK